MLIGCNINISFGQNDCYCNYNLSEKEQIILNEKDSLAYFHIIDKYKKSKSISCQYKSKILEFEYYYSQKNIHKTQQVLDEQKMLLNKADCDNFLFNYNYNNTLYSSITNNYENLSKFSFKALKIAEKLNDSRKKIKILKQIVYLFTRMKENKKRWNYVKRAEKLILNQKKSIQTISDYRWLSYQYENQYTKTEREALIDSMYILINKVKKEALKNNLNREISNLYRGLEAYSYHKKELNNALIYIDSAIYFSRKIKNYKNISGLYLSKSWDHYDLKQYKEAIKWIDTALYYDDKTDVAGFMMLLSEASEIYEGSNALDRAIVSLKTHSKLKDSIMSLERSNVINELETKYQTELKDSKIKSLTTLLIISVLAILSLLLITTLFRLKQFRKQNYDLKIALDKQLKLEEELVCVREKIAQNFHDDLGNKLARISFLSQMISENHTLKNFNIKNKIIQITKDANDLYNGTRDFIFSLKKNSDNLDEIITYLSDFGRDYFNKTSIKFTLKKNNSEDIKLPYYWSKQIIYIFKEAMTNALKHSNCKEVVLKFEYKNNLLIIQCIDNGSGINEDNLDSFNGLKHMVERANKIGGKLNINSKISLGTTIEFIGNTT